MREHFNKFIIPILLVVVIFTLCVGCGKKDDSNPGTVVQSDSGQLVSAISKASTETEHQQAIEKVVSRGFSLGLIDINGKQLNPNVGKNAISLSPISVATYSQMDTGTNYRNIEYIVAFLADAGIALDSTGDLINLNDFLPDLQKYVDWSYSNPNDPASVLGIMIASGPDMVVPALPPTISGDTKVLPLTSLLIVGDILVGTEKEQNAAPIAKGIHDVYAATTTANSGALTKVRGLITTIKSVPILQSLLPPKAINILSAFQTCDRLSVRMWQMPDSPGREKNWENNITDTLPLTKIFKIEKDKTESINVIGGVGIMAGITGSPIQTIEGVDIAYRFQLLSYDEQGTGVPLYDDADAMLSSLANAGIDSFTFSTDLNGHRLLAQSKGNVPFTISVKSMSNQETRTVLLHASAQITAPENLYEQAEQKLAEKIKNSWALLAATSALDTLPWKDIKDTMVILNRNFQPTPWMCTVEFIPIKDKTSETTSKSITNTTTTSTNTNSTDKPNIALEIEIPEVLETLETIMFKANLSVALDKLPLNATWQVEFGDGTPVETKVGREESDLLFGHRYLKNGDYQIKLSLTDPTTKQTLATATEKFIISDITSIRKTNHLQLILTLSGKTERKDTTAVPEYNLRYFNDDLKPKEPWTFEWFDELRTGSPGQWGGDEIKFKGSYKSISNVDSGTQTKEYWISGKIVVDRDGIKLVDYNHMKQFSNPNYNGTGKEWSYDYSLKLNPVPITKLVGGDSPKYQYHLQGYDQIYPYVEFATYSEHFADGKEIQWQPMLKPELTGSDLSIIIETFKLTN